MLAFQNISNGWSLDNGSIISMINNTGIKQTIANATDPAQIELLKQKMNYINAARLLLVGLFAAISVLVYVAYNRRRKLNLQTQTV